MVGHKTINVDIYGELLILQEFVLGCGAAERHPSGDLNDWFVADGNTCKCLTLLTVKGIFG